ncbi:16S rRNA (guanine(966)-N(2))-methyltransferase RsmD [Austwickia chelonae]|uniref:16S rRNA (guanine(966)-N(2))-methyltransferase RsmD n=1 Tax=Austwickia chelonae TaxID=100225 RepID=UPI000E241DFF|nr:16S rRNA (guanine(966)-N(2))-methyltransferase RsmD [Austwickia chelonae]
MTRIVAGVAGGLRLATPSGAGTRPTSDRVREALFSRLDHLGVLEGARVLDLYAGSGALGLEAMSRGAQHVVLVEQARAAAGVARRNLAQVAEACRGAADRCSGTVRGESVQRVLDSGPTGEAYDLVFSDPPYELAEERLCEDLELLMRRHWLTETAMVVVERSARSPEPEWPRGLRRFSEKRYGETQLWFAELDLTTALFDESESS